MKNTSKKRLERQQKKDAERRRRDREQSQRAHNLSLSPTFRYESNGAPEELVRAVRKEVSDAVCKRSKVFDEDQLFFLKEAKRLGFRRVLSLIAETPTPSDDVEAGMHGFIAAISPEKLAETIYNRLSVEVQRAYFPLCSFKMVYGNPRPNEIRVVFDSLEAVKTPGGTAFRARLPSLVIEGSPHDLAFSNHAVERVSERCVDFPGSYLGSLLTFYALSNAGFTVDQCRLPAGEHAIRLWVKILASESGVGGIPKAVLGYEPDAGAKFCYLAGYCPLVIHQRLAVAKTMLAPGMKNTPEASVIDLRKLDLRTFLRVKEKIDDQSFSRLLKDGDFELMRLRHRAGFEQVRRDE